jgi:hypothetical protein
MRKPKEKLIAGIDLHGNNLVRIVRRLREETTMTLKWVAAALQIGSWTDVSNLIYHSKKSVKKCQ